MDPYGDRDPNTVGRWLNTLEGLPAKSHAPVIRLELRPGLLWTRLGDQASIGYSKQ